MFFRFKTDGYRRKVSPKVSCDFFQTETNVTSNEIVLVVVDGCILTYWLMGGYFF